MRNFLRIVGALGDYVLLMGILSFVVRIRTQAESIDFVLAEYYRHFFWIFGIWILVFYLFDLYNFDASPRFARFFFSLILCLSLTILFFYLFSNFTFITPKTVLAFLIVFFSGCFYLWHKILDIVFVKFFRGHNIMMAVSSVDSVDLAKKLYTNPRLKYHVEGILVSSDCKDEVYKIFDKSVIYTSIEEFEVAIKQQHIITIVSTDIWFSKLYGLLYDLFPRKVRIINFVNFYERLLGFIPVHSTSSHWIMTNVDFVSRRMFVTAKRFFDIVFVITLLPFALPLMIVIACFIKVLGEKKGTTLFSQKRVGIYNQEFLLYKFRTMHMNAEAKGAQWASQQDPRITKLGKILRLTRLDELPQLFNILKGEMSFIGPRPERMEFVQHLQEEIPHYQLRHMIKPGLTGWAQVRFRYGNSVEDSAIKLCYDMFYIKNMNFVLDIRILLRTIVKVVSAKGQ